jgi:hypothetical protein
LYYIMTNYEIEYHSHHVFFIVQRVHILNVKIIIIMSIIHFKFIHFYYHTACNTPMKICT